MKMYSQAETNHSVEKRALKRDWTGRLSSKKISLIAYKSTSFCLINVLKHI
jgi:hypothetical protein